MSTNEEMALPDAPSAYDIRFTVLPPEQAPEIPDARGARESPLRAALKALPRGGFLFVIGNDPGTRKRISDICTRIRKDSVFREFAIRTYTQCGREGLGIWRVDTSVLDRPKAKVVETDKEVPQPSKSQLMAGR